MKTTPMLAADARRIILSTLIVCAGLATSGPATAAPTPWKPGHRIAITADGCPDADADDTGGTPMTLAILAKAGLQECLVHHDFNNWLEYKPIAPEDNRMWFSTIGGQSRWQFVRNRFFDAAQDPAAAIASLTAEINKSTTENPLYLVAAGPLELAYQAMSAAEPAARGHVRIVTHHRYNNYFRPRLWQRNLDQILELHPSIQVIQIKDQNGTLRTESEESWHWLRDHADPNLRWVFERIQASKPDVSDAGIVAWLIGLSGDDETITIDELRHSFGSAPIPTKGPITAAPPPPPAVNPAIHLPGTASLYEEVDGRLVIEAETVPVSGQWVVEDSEPGFSGKGYLRYKPANLGIIEQQHRGVLIYKLRITNPGKYRMAFKHSHRGAPERDRWNDVWTLMGIDIHPFGMVRKTYHSSSKEMFARDEGFSFDTTHDNYGTILKLEGKFTQPVYDLPAGDHYFFLAARSGGYRLDKIHFVKEGVDGFKDDSIPATPVKSSSFGHSVAEFALLPAEKGRTTYYRPAKNPEVLAINAAIPGNRGKFAAAQLDFKGESGRYDLGITTITEIDGESTYRLLVDGKLVATHRSPRVNQEHDLKPRLHTWRDIEVKKGSKLTIESNADSNDLIPEGEGFAWSRGRWARLDFFRIDAP